MKSGRLNKVIVIEELSTITNEFGEEEKSIYAPKFRTKAEVKNDGGNRETDNGEVFYSQIKTFIFWDYINSYLSDYDRIIYEGKPYRVINKDLNKEDKILYVKGELINE